MEAFRLANLIDDSGNWTGGSTTVVQVGDVLDRGGDEIKILYFLERLRRQVDKTNGKVITMNDNHKIMKVESDFRYINGFFFFGCGAVVVFFFVFLFYYILFYFSLHSVIFY